MEDDEHSKPEGENISKMEHESIIKVEGATTRNTEQEDKSAVEGKSAGDTDGIKAKDMQGKSTNALDEGNDPLFPCDSDDDVIFVREVIHISSDDEAEAVDRDFVNSPPSEPDDRNDDSSRIVISTDASCNHLTAGGTCVIMEDITFGSRTRTVAIEPAGDCTLAELVTITAAVRWGCQLVEEKRRRDDDQVKKLKILCDCTAAVSWWNST